MSKRKTLSEILAEFTARHGTLFNYSDVMCNGVDTPVIIQCNTCDTIFKQTPYQHLKTAGGCPTCRSAACVVAATQDLDAFKRKVLAKFGDVYTYDKSVYVGCKEYITVECKFCNETLTSTPNNHLFRVNSCPCQQTAARGFQEYLPAMLYYLKVEYKGNTAYKIGITNKDVAARFRSNQKGDITVLKTWDFLKGRDARIEESRILKEFKVYKWQGIDLLSDGNTELFTRDVLEVCNHERD